MKKILGTLIAVCTLFVFAGCDTPVSTNPPHSSDTEQNTGSGESQGNPSTDNSNTDDSGNTGNTGGNTGNTGGNTGNTGGNTGNTGGNTTPVQTPSVLLVGKWYCSNGGLNKFLEFYANGTGKAYADPNQNYGSNSFNYSLNGNRITFTGQLTGSAQFTVNANTLQIINPSYYLSSATFTYVRK